LDDENGCGSEPGFGVGLRANKSDWKTAATEKNGMLSNSFAHIMSHQGLVPNHKSVSSTFWTWYGTDCFLGHHQVPGATRCLDPDG